LRTTAHVNIALNHSCQYFSLTEPIVTRKCSKIKNFQLLIFKLRIKHLRTVKPPDFRSYTALNIGYYNNVFTNKRVPHTSLLQNYFDQLLKQPAQEETTTKDCRTYSLYDLYQTGCSKFSHTFESFCL